MQLIPILKHRIGKTKVNSASAKEIHKQLEIIKPFSDWIKNQINRADLTENIDYVLHHLKVKQNGSGGHNAKDYILTLDSAKHICMMSQSKKAKEVRDYFISIETKYLAELEFKILESENGGPPRYPIDMNGIVTTELMDALSTHINKLNYENIKYFDLRFSEIKKTMPLSSTVQQKMIDMDWMKPELLPSEQYPVVRIDFVCDLLDMMEKYEMSTQTIKELIQKGTLC